MRWHTTPDAAPVQTTVIDVTHVADHLSTAVSNALSPGEMTFRPCEGSMQRLGLKAEDLPEIVLASQEAVAALTGGMAGD